MFLKSNWLLLKTYLRINNSIMSVENVLTNSYSFAAKHWHLQVYDVCFGLFLLLKLVFRRYVKWLHFKPIESRRSGRKCVRLSNVCVSKQETRPWILNKTHSFWHHGNRRPKQSCFKEVLERCKIMNRVWTNLASLCNLGPRGVTHWHLCSTLLHYPLT